MAITTARSTSGLREQVARWRADGHRIAVVPTMGALHDGHLSLVRTALDHADRVIATLFVNPAQFDDPDDLARYPRTEARDAEQLGHAGAHLLYAPDAGLMYPEGFSTRVSVGGVSEGLCGAFRPGHFDGVATVVSKLLLRTGADVACFGEKDYQQLQIVRRLVADLDIAVQIVGCATVRDADGLAMSSRNARLPDADRAVAPALYRALSEAAAAIAAGGAVDTTLAQARNAVLHAGFTEVEYLELRAAHGLAPMLVPDRPGRLLAAAWLGGVRLIDNVPVAMAGM